jgi:hypothetical protein
MILNTGLDGDAGAGIDLDDIDESQLAIPPRAANLMLYLIAMWRPPAWLWNRSMSHVRASNEPQKLYPRLNPDPARDVALQARAGAPARHGLLDRAGQDGLLRPEGRPRGAVAEALHAPPGAAGPHEEAA